MTGARHCVVKGLLGGGGGEGGGEGYTHGVQTKRTRNVDFSERWNRQTCVISDSINPVHGIGDILGSLSTVRGQDSDTIKLDLPESPGVITVNAQPEFGGTLHRIETFRHRFTFGSAFEEHLLSGPCLANVKLDTDCCSRTCHFSSRCGGCFPFHPTAGRSGVRRHPGCGAGWGRGGDRERTCVRERC
jgi:hypothetical protein